MLEHHLVWTTMTREKPPLSIRQKKNVEKICFLCVFIKFFASKPQTDVCACSFSLYSILLLHTLFFLTMTGLYTMLIFFIFYKENSFMGWPYKWNMQHAYFYFLCAIFYRCRWNYNWTLNVDWIHKKITKKWINQQRPFSIFIEIYQLNLYLHCERFLVDIFAVSHIENGKKQGQVLTKSFNMWNKCFPLSILLSKWIFMCVLHTDWNWIKYA